MTQKISGNLVQGFRLHSKVGPLLNLLQWGEQLPIWLGCFHNLMVGRHLWCSQGQARN